MTGQRWRRPTPKLARLRPRPAGLQHRGHAGGEDGICVIRAKETKTGKSAVGYEDGRLPLAIITGGTVVIGVEESLVHLGEVQRVKFDCDRDGQRVTDQQREMAGGVFRRLSLPSKAR